MFNKTKSAIAAFLIFGFSSNVIATELSLQLNWKAGGDHAPIYYALSQGWYADAGVELEVTPIKVFNLAISPCIVPINVPNA